jgi:hypothetical protein
VNFHQPTYKTGVKWRSVAGWFALVCVGSAIWHGSHLFSASILENSNQSAAFSGHGLQAKGADSSQSFFQLSYAVVPVEGLGLPQELVKDFPGPVLPREISRRRVPPLTHLKDFYSAQLMDKAVPLTEANTLAHVNYQQRRFGQLQAGSSETLLFNPETILVKFRDSPQVSALRVEPMREWEAVQALTQRSDVQFAELDTFQRRQYSPNDPQITSQWHHRMIGSFKAWDVSLGQPFVRIAIVDTPFQMDHPDLASNTVGGWDVVNNTPVTSSPGIEHSTMCAGMAAAVIGNSQGVAGAGNCQILPININGYISEMHDAIIWAADHDVWVVSISWTGGNDDTLEAAGYYLKTKARGILAMAGVNGSGLLDYTNQPDIYCIAMTDAADNQRSTHGDHIDFAAPGWQILSTTTNGGYAIGTGTSYSTPLFSGLVGVLMSINPTLAPDEIIDLIKNSAADKGQPGWDQYFGWGRVNFGAAASAAAQSLPLISSVHWTNAQVVVSAGFKPGLNYLLWKTPQLAPPTWTVVTNAALQTNAGTIVLTDPAPAGSPLFYRIQAGLP